MALCLYVVCAILIQYVQYLYNMLNTNTICAILIQYVQIGEVACELFVFVRFPLDALSLLACVQIDSYVAP